MSRSHSFDSPDVEKEFPGLYMSDLRPGETPGSEYKSGEEFSEKLKLKKDLLKKDKKEKDKKKDKGYVVFEEENSDDEKRKNEDVRSPARLKKHSKPSFKFAKKDKFVVVKKEKEERKDGSKEKRKEEYKEKKLRMKKKPKLSESGDECKPIFGVPLPVAVARNRCYDGIELPVLVRECIDYIEEHGLTCEGIYRISGVKSKVQALKEAYNKGRQIQIFEHEPNVVASLLKQFLRELPDPVLTIQLMPAFEEASTIKDHSKKATEFKNLIQQLPLCNRLLLSWIILHMLHVIARADQNKMTLQNVSIVLSPTMQISHRVLNVLFHHATTLFAGTSIKRYVPPLKPAMSKWSLELPDQPMAIEEELEKQESLLNQLHAEINAGMTDSDKEEQLWEVQRIVTQLKRKLKSAKKPKSHQPTLNTIDDDIVLNLALATEAPDVQAATTAVVAESEPTTSAALATNTETSTAADVTAAESDVKIEKDVDKSDEVNIETDSKVEESETKVEESETKVEESETKVEESEPKVEESEPKENESETKADSDTETKAEEEKPSDLESETDKVDNDSTQAEITPQQVEVSEITVEVEISSDVIEDTVKVTDDEVNKVTAVTDVEVHDTVDEVEEKQPEPTEEEEDDVFDATTPVPEIMTSSQEAVISKPTLQLKTDSMDSSALELSDIITPTDENQSITEEMDEAPAPKPIRNIVFRPIRDDESSFDDTESIGMAPDEVTSGAIRPVLVPPHSLPITDGVHRPEPRTPENDWAPNRSCDFSDVPDVPPRPPIGWNPSLQSPLKPEILHKKLRQQSAVDEEEEYSSTDEDRVDGDSPGPDDSGVESQDEEYKSLVYHHQVALLEEEELLAIGVELRQKIEAERDEMERLEQEIVEVRSMRGCSSDEEDQVMSSDSDRESGDEEELTNIVQKLTEDNRRLERDNSELVKKIDVERMICLEVKVQIRMIQQQAERYTDGTDSLL